MSKDMVISYLMMRKSIGIMGMILAFMCIIGGLIFGSGKIESSISAYYMTNMRDLMMIVLGIAGAFLLSYKGYDKTDNVITNISGVSAFFVAIFPMAYMLPGNIFNIPMPAIQIIHFISESILFLSLAIMSIFQFTQVGSSLLYRMKILRNTVYRICGYSIILMIIISAFVKLFHWNEYIILVTEIIMLLAFGVSWLIKSESLLKD